MFRRLILQRFLFQVKDNTFISIYKTVPQEAPWKNGFSDQRSRGNIAKSIPLYDLLYASSTQQHMEISSTSHGKETYLT